MMAPRGRLLGLGVGPGDPELITLKALRLLREAPVVGYFVAKGKRGNAFGIIEAHLQPEQTLLPLVYPVTTEVLPAPLSYEQVISDFYDAASVQVAEHLDAGRDVAVICEGDPFFYGSYMYLHDRLAELGPPAVIEAIAGLASGTLMGEVQDDALANYAHKLNKDEARIDWSRPAIELERLIRAFNPWPICHSTLNEAPLKVLAGCVGEGQGQPGEILAASKDGLTVACGTGALLLTRLQLPGGKALNFSDLFNSRREQFAVGTVLA